MSIINKMDSNLQYTRASAAKTEAKIQGMKNTKDLEKVAKEFSQLLIKDYLEVSYKTNADDKMFGGGKGEEIFHGMLLDEYAKTMSEPGRFGLSEIVYAELLRLQEVKNGE